MTFDPDHDAAFDSDRRIPVARREAHVAETWMSQETFEHRQNIPAPVGVEPTGPPAARVVAKAAGTFGRKIKVTTRPPRGTAERRRLSRANP